MAKKETSLTPGGSIRDPLAMLRQELDRMFDEATWPSFRWPLLRTRAIGGSASWTPGIDVFEGDNRLVTKIDLPGMKKEDVKVEVINGHLTISGERKTEAEERKEHYYRSEREYGSFYRTVPLPEGVKLDDVKATFADGVLEVSVPMPVAQPEETTRRIEIQEGSKPPKAA